jgi:hypothetical protein
VVELSLNIYNLFPRSGEGKERERERERDTRVGKIKVSALYWTTTLLHPRCLSLYLRSERFVHTYLSFFENSSLKNKHALLALCFIPSFFVLFSVIRGVSWRVLRVSGLALVLLAFLTNAEKKKKNSHRLRFFF